MRAGLTCLLMTLWPFAVWAGGSPVVDFPIGRSGVTFSTPSNNIECHYTPRGGSEIYKTQDNLAELSCDRAAPVYLRFVMGERGSVALIKNSGEQPCCSGENPIPYGSAWDVPPFRCESAERGLTCERPDGHGFFISRSATKTY